MSSQRAIADMLFKARVQYAETVRVYGILGAHALNTNESAESQNLYKGQVAAFDALFEHQDNVVILLECALAVQDSTESDPLWKRLFE